MPNKINSSSRNRLPAKYRGLKPRSIKAVRPPKRSRFRRLVRFFINPYTFSFSLLVLLLVSLTFTYFWFEYSDRIDLLLRGEIFTSTAGIYAAPKTLKVGEKITKDEVVEYPNLAGYIQKNQQADESRSRYEAGANEINIEPGKTAIIDSVEKFPTIKVKFSKSEKAVASITFIKSGNDVKEALLEPKILSSIAAEGDGKRKVIKFNDLPPHLVKAITVTEDRAFFDHYGVNFRGIGRALWRRYENDTDDSPLSNQGGSSITQQLVKNLLLNRDKTIERKVKEAYMSVILETRLSKEQIFTLYVNQIYLGQDTGVSIYGVGEASNAYFGKDVSELTLAESAFIAGIIRSPNRYNPRKRPAKVKERRNQVLSSMLEVNEITYKQSAEAKEESLEIRKATTRNLMQEMPYFAQYAVEQVPTVVSDPDALQHMRIYTTIDPDLQKKAYEIVNRRLERLDKYFKKKGKGNLQASLVAIRPKTGEVVAMVGGRDFLETQFNRATSAQRQPGSVFKPFVYAAAINSAYSASPRVLTTASIFTDEKKEFRVGKDTYSPNNYGDFFSGADITLRDALVKSKNTITVSIGSEIGIGKVMDLANKAGLPKVEKAYPAMALGTSEATPLQMAEAYSMFANLGEKVSPMAINRVTNGEGETVVAPQPIKRRVIRNDVAYIMTDMLKDVINRGTAYEARAWGFKNEPGKVGIAGKTGTSRDGWFAGFTPDLVCVVYVGFDDGSDLGMKGSDSAMPIWAEFMREALREHPEWNGDWEMPNSVLRGEIDTRNGKLIREVFSNEEADAKAAEEKKKKEEKEKLEKKDEPEIDDLLPDDLEKPKEIYVTDVPAEFRRIDYFVGGTLPNKNLLMPDDLDGNNIDTDSTNNKPKGSPTPFVTWEQEQNQKQTGNDPAPQDKPISRSNIEGVENSVSVMICNTSRMRSTIYCPIASAKSYAKGTEPKQFCSIHRQNE